MTQTCRFEFSRHADRLFAKLKRNVQKRIRKQLEGWEKKEKPLQYAKKLRGHGERYSFRVGDYRIICAKHGAGHFVILMILTVGHRKNVYE